MSVADRNPPRGVREEHDAQPTGPGLLPSLAAHGRRSESA